MTAVPGERTLKDGADELTVRFESPVQGGVKLVKTYTFKRGEYAVGVKHEIVNAGNAPVSLLADKLTTEASVTAFTAILDAITLAPNEPA